MTVADASLVPRETAILRALRGRCPNCGRGALLHRYLKVVDKCAACGEAYGHLRPDDAAPWMTILITGHLVVPLALMIQSRFDPPLWLQMLIWPAAIVALALVLLPRCKGVVLALLWSMKAEGSEPTPTQTPP